MLNKFQIVKCVECGVELDEASDTIGYLVGDYQKPMCEYCHINAVHLLEKESICRT